MDGVEKSRDEVHLESKTTALRENGGLMKLTFYPVTGLGTIRIRVASSVTGDDIVPARGALLRMGFANLVADKRQLIALPATFGARGLGRVRRRH